jgi:hypothetical protein
VKLNQRTRTCLEWQHTGKPCQHVLAFVSSQKEFDLEQFVHEYYSMDRFKAAYAGEIKPMTDKMQWPEVKLPFVGAPFAKGEVGRRRKLRLRGFMEGGHKKKGAKDGDDTTEDGGANVGDNAITPTNAKGQKMKRGPMTCLKCGKQVAGKLVPSADSI